MKYSQLKGLLRVANAKIELAFNTFNYKGNKPKSCV